MEFINGMIKKLKVEVLLLIMIVVAISLKAQTSQTIYEYDANGNRVSAKVIYLSNAPSLSSQKIEEELKIEEATSLAIKIYPNPTKGTIYVELNGFDQQLGDSQRNELALWDMQGKLMHKQHALSALNAIDLSSYSKGTYILHLNLKGKLRKYLIVKN